jgi:hypothetical protein
VFEKLSVVIEDVLGVIFLAIFAGILFGLPALAEIWYIVPIFGDNFIGLVIEVITYMVMVYGLFCLFMLSICYIASVDQRAEEKKKAKQAKEKRAAKKAHQ